MSDGIDSSPITPETLGIRVGLLEKRDIDIEKRVNFIGDTMATKTDVADIARRLQGDIANIASQIQGLIAQQTQASKPDYKLQISFGTFLIAVMTVIGTLAYWPINSATSRLETAVATLADKAVTQRQYESDLARINSDRIQLRTDLTAVQSGYVQQQRVARDEAELEALRDKAVTRDAFTALGERVRRLEDMQFKVR